MKVSVVSPYALDHHGGVQSHARQLVSHLVATGVEAQLVGPGRAPATAQEIQVGGSLRISVNRSEAPIGLNPVGAARIRDAIRGSDVVHVHEPWVPLAGWAAQLGAAPTVLTFHADPSRLVRSMYRTLRRPLASLVRRSAAVTVVSARAAGAIAPFCPDPVHIPNAVDANPLSDLGDRGPSVAFVGRDEDRKGLSVLLAAWPLIREEVPQARLRVVSDTQRSPVEGVEFVGAVDDEAKLRVLSSSAVFVAPNTGGESFGITLAEAMAAGCAVVASDLDAFADVLGGAGSLVPVGDASAIAQRVVELFRDPELVAERSAASRARVEAYTWTTVVPRYLEVYESAVL